MVNATRIIIFKGCGKRPSLCKCKACGKKFVMDKQIVTKVSGHNKRVRYHLKCAQQKNVI